MRDMSRVHLGGQHCSANSAKPVGVGPNVGVSQCLSDLRAKTDGGMTTPRVPDIAGFAWMSDVDVFGLGGLCVRSTVAGIATDGLLLACNVN